MSHKYYVFVLTDERYERRWGLPIHAGAAVRSRSSVLTVSFEKFEGAYLALWLVEAGHLPSVSEAVERLEYLSLHGESERAFTCRRPFSPTGKANDELIITPFDPCPAI
jgi:hypothetical protein